MAIPALEIEITADTTAADVGFKKLERSLDGLEEATRDYQRALDKINKAEKSGIITTKQSAAAIRGAEQAYKSAAKSAAQYSGAQANFRRASMDSAKAVGGMSGAIDRNKFAIQQAGYQVGDFAVQVGGGTSAITAFSQQGSQMLGVFGPMGAVAGAAIAVLGPLALAFMNSSEGAKTLAENMTALAEAMEATNSAQTNASMLIGDLSDKYGEYALAVGQVLSAQREIANLQAERALSDAVASLAEEFGTLKTVVDDMGSVIIPGSEEAFRRIIRTMDATSSQASELVRSLKELGDAEGPEAQRAAIDRVKDALLDATGGVQNMDAETLAVYQSLLDAELAASQLAAIDVASNIGAAADNAARLTSNLEKSAQAWAEYNAAQSWQNGMTTGKGITLLDLEYGDFAPPKSAGAAKSSGGGKKGGGGGAPDRIGALAKSLMDEGEVVANWREESLAALADFNALELEALGGHNEARLRIEDEYQSKLAAIKASERQMMIAGVSGALGDVATLMQSENKKIFAIGKAASLAGAVIKGYEAAVDAWQSGMKIGGPPVAAAFTAASLAKTGMLISNIASQQVGGGTAGATGGGGGGGGGASTAAAAAPAPANYYIDLQGDTFSRASVQSTLSAALQGEIDRGARVVFGGA